MCRLLGYLGPPLQLDTILCEPEHSLVVQSYQPREMTSGLLNADGFGIGWYHSQRETDPFTYKNTLPIWSDINLPSFSRYVEAGCLVACVRSATPGQALDFSNCQPFQHDRFLFVHNGFIQNFRQSLYRPIRSHLQDVAYQSIDGTTDSEHIFALIISELIGVSQISLKEALHNALKRLTDLAKSAGVEFSANTIVSDGRQLVASRVASGKTPPSLYWLRDDPSFPEAITIASEPLFAGNWQPFSANSLLSVGENREIEISEFS